MHFYALIVFYTYPSFLLLIPVYHIFHIFYEVVVIINYQNSIILHGHLSLHLSVKEMAETG